MGMLPLLIAGIAALAIVVIAVGIAMSAGGGGVSARLERYASGRDPDADGEDGEPESAVVAGVSRVLDRQDFTARLATDLARADLKMKPAEFIILWAITPIGFVFVAFMLGIVFQGFRNPVALVGAFVLGLFAPRFYLKRRQGESAQGIRRAAARHDHPARELAPSRLLVPAGHGARHPRGAATDQRGVRARGARDAARPRPPAGTEQPRTAAWPPRTWT